MVDLKHQRGAAAKTPVRCKAVGLLEMIENGGRQIEKDRPFAWPPGRHPIRPPAAACSPTAWRTGRRPCSPDPNPRPYPSETASEQRREPRKRTKRPAH